MEIILLVVGSTQEKYIKDGLEVYSNRLSKYSKFKIVSVLNSDKLYDFIKKGDRFILLDERGSSFSSRGLSNQFQKWMNSGPKRLIFGVGGPYGFNKLTYEKSDDMISLGPMTFTHDMVRLIFLEQLYRSWTILRGEPYHHE